jgi:hypothetical protein
MWIFKRIKAYAQYITPRFAQNNYLVWKEKNQAFEGLESVASNMTGFGSIQ